MSTSKVRVAKLSDRLFDEGKKFGGMYQIWLAHNGVTEAGDWTARHVGRLVEHCCDLEQRVRKLERRQPRRQRSKAK